MSDLETKYHKNIVNSYIKDTKLHMTKLKLISINEMIYDKYPSTGTNPFDY